MVAAIIMWTLYSLIGRRLVTPPITATAISTGIAVALMAPFAFAQGIDTAKIGALSITGILYMVIFPSVCSFVFWNLSVQAIGASRAGVFLNLVPAFTALISGAFGVRITEAQVIGGLLVFCGVYLTTGMLESSLKVEKVKI